MKNTTKNDNCTCSASAKTIFPAIFALAIILLLPFNRLAAQTQDSTVLMAQIDSLIKNAKPDRLTDSKLGTLGEKWIAKYVLTVPETDREKFIATAWDVIMNEGEGGKKTVRVVIENTGLTEYKAQFIEMKNGWRADAEDHIAQTEQETAQIKQETAQIKQETAQIEQRIGQQLIEMEQDILKLIPKGADYAKEHFLQEIQAFVTAFEKRNYLCDDKTLAFLEEMGISTANLPRKKK